MPDFDLSGELSLKIELHMLRPITEKVHSGNGPVSLAARAVAGWETTLGRAWPVTGWETTRPLLFKGIRYPIIVKGVRHPVFFYFFIKELL